MRDAAFEGLRDTRERDDGRLLRSRDVLRRGAHDELLDEHDGEEEGDAEQAATMFVAQSVSGSIE